MRTIAERKGAERPATKDWARMPGREVRRRLLANVAAVGCCCDGGFVEEGAGLNLARRRRAEEDSIKVRTKMARSRRRLVGSEGGGLFETVYSTVVGLGRRVRR